MPETAWITPNCLTQMSIKLIKQYTIIIQYFRIWDFIIIFVVLSKSMKQQYFNKYNIWTKTGGPCPLGPSTPLVGTHKSIVLLKFSLIEFSVVFDRDEQQGGTRTSGAWLPNAESPGLSKFSTRADGSVLEERCRRAAHFWVPAGLPWRLLHGDRTSISAWRQPLNPASWTHPDLLLPWPFLVPSTPSWLEACTASWVHLSSCYSPMASCPSRLKTEQFAQTFNLRGVYMSKLGR